MLKWPGIKENKFIKASGYIFDSFHICQTAKGDKDGKWTTVVAAMVFIATD